MWFEKDSFLIFEMKYVNFSSREYILSGYWLLISLIAFTKRIKLFNLDFSQVFTRTCDLCSFCICKNVRYSITDNIDKGLKRKKEVN